MLPLPGAPGLDELSRKWLRLSERRLAYYAELYRSGRWQHYYSKDEIGARLRDLMEVLKVWRKLPGEPPRDDKSDLRPAA